MVNKVAFSKTEFSRKISKCKGERTDGDSINCFLRANTFYIGFKIMFLEILNKEIQISFLSNDDYSH